MFPESTHDQKHIKRIVTTRHYYRNTKENRNVIPSHNLPGSDKAPKSPEQGYYEG